MIYVYTYNYEYQVSGLLLFIFFFFWYKSRKQTQKRCLSNLIQCQIVYYIHTFELKQLQSNM